MGELVSGRIARNDFRIVDRGTGTPLVVIPGIQGHWRYARGLVDAFARWHRVITFSLGDERDGRNSARPTIDRFAEQVEAALDRLQIPEAAIVGVSFGGLVALRFAASQASRTRALVMLSAPGPHWHLRPRHDVYARFPRLFVPVFLAEAPFRLHREVKAALPGWPARFKYLREQARTIVTAPVSPSRMAARARLIASYDRVADCRVIARPTLIVQGDDALDHVTGSGGTAEYARLIAGARLVQMPNTGHLGSVTRADECAAIVHGFLLDANKDERHSAA